MIRVLVVDDSIVLRKLICRLLVKDPDIEVAGQCENGEQALSFVLSNPVDVVTMDIQMPVMEGFQATKRIMEEKPMPVVVVSSCLEPDDVEKTFKAIEAGAVAVLPKPSHRAGGFEDYGEQLRRTIKDASLASVGKLLSCRIDRFGEVDCKSIKTVVVGASTGGPQALAGMLSVIPGDFPAPLFVVQHIASGFLEGMSQWLSSCTDLKVKVANNGERPSPGTVYLAPEGRHMEIYHSRQGRRGRVCRYPSRRRTGLRGEHKAEDRREAGVGEPQSGTVSLSHAYERWNTQEKVRFRIQPFRLNDKGGQKNVQFQASPALISTGQEERERPDLIDDPGALFLYLHSFSISSAFSVVIGTNWPTGPFQLLFSAISSSRSSGTPSSSRVTGMPMLLKYFSMTAIPSRTVFSGFQKSGSRPHTLWKKRTKRATS